MGNCFGYRKIRKSFRNCCLVVSQEKISSTKKIPAVCRAFNIEHYNLEAFLKDNGMRFGIVK